MMIWKFVRGLFGRHRVDRPMLSESQEMEHAEFWYRAWSLAREALHPPRCDLRGALRINRAHRGMWLADCRRVRARGSLGPY